MHLLHTGGMEKHAIYQDPGSRETPEHASTRLLLWLFFLGLAMLAVVRYAATS